MRMRDQGKIATNPAVHAPTRDGPHQELEQAPPHAMTEIHRFFLDYKVLEEKEVVVDPFQGRESAIAVIRQALADYWTMRAAEK